MQEDSGGLEMGYKDPQGVGDDSYRTLGDRKSSRQETSRLKKQLTYLKKDNIKLKAVIKRYKELMNEVQYYERITASHKKLHSHNSILHSFSLSPVPDSPRHKTFKNSTNNNTIFILIIIPPITDYYSGYFKHAE